MNQCGSSFEQVGIVLASSGDDVKISIEGSGCSACHKSLCILGNSEAKEISLKAQSHFYQIGDQVVVSINPSSGYMAVFTLYLIPFVLMIIALWLTTTLGYSEPVAGLSSVLILIPYFSGVFLLRGKVQFQCKIGIRKK